MPLTFDQLRAANVERCAKSFHGPMLWTPTDWACALGGEVGEALNLVKKLRRLAPTPEQLQPWEAEQLGEAAGLKHAIGKELADVVAYADLLAHRLGIDLGAVVAAKFNEVSERVGSAVKLSDASAPLPDVLSEVVVERRRQDQIWGGPSHDDGHSPADWIEYIFDQFAKLGIIVPLTRHYVQERQLRGRLVKVAALAAAAIESIDRREIPKAAPKAEA